MTASVSYGMEFRVLARDAPWNGLAEGFAIIRSYTVHSEKRNDQVVVAQLVERHVANVKDAGPNPVNRTD